MYLRQKWMLFAASVFFSAFAPVFAGTFDLEIREAEAELRPGLTTSAWTYNGTIPGTPIVAEVGERVTVNVVNKLDVATNIHWHGLELPNDQDGPSIVIEPGERFTYSFVAPESGTYWYHSHRRPVLEQMDMGLYGAFIIKEKADSKYSGDHAFILDDWFLGANGERLPGTASGMMERYGNIETVNGKSGAAIEPLLVKRGELHKLRFINASTAAVHRLRINGHRFRVTHTDGHPLTDPYLTEELILNPGERLDAELSASGDPGKTFEIASDRPKLGIRIPIRYVEGTATVTSPFVPPKSRAFPGIFEARPDKVFTLNSGMGNTMGSAGQMMGSGGHMMGGMGGAGMGMMIWTINGKAFPDTAPLRVKTGQTVKLRFKNDDTGMMHPMDHPIHIHGTYFQIVSVDGVKPERETWKDTVNVPAGKYVDIAFSMKNPGDWMLHCHIIDHEDNGMAMVIEAK